ncbi:MAG: ferritin family protein [Gammaproteobacteria bacterium]|nr:ferritin family protein [Gammaproteobacteria bacterium]
MAEGSGYQQLKNLSTIAEILTVAIRFETTARDFYNAMQSKVSKRLRYLVDELASEEQQHMDLFTKLMQQDNLAEVLQQEIERPASDHKFSDCIHLPELGDAPDDQAILQYALMREHAAMEQYTALAKTAPEGPVKALFMLLANEETKHKNDLEKLYYEIVHSGGV